MCGKLYTSYFANLKNVQDEKTLFLVVAQFPPKSFIFTKQIQHVPLFAPSKGLLKNMKEGLLSENEYTVIYNKQIVREMIPKIEQLVSYMRKGHDVCLLCYEKPEDFCHRHLLAKFINEKYLIETKEL